MLSVCASVETEDIDHDEAHQPTNFPSRPGRSLRGCAVPRLPLGTRRQGAAVAGTPKRLIVMFTHYGCLTTKFFPTKSHGPLTAADLESTTLKPLAPYVEQAALAPWHPRDERMDLRPRAWPGKRSPHASGRFVFHLPAGDSEQRRPLQFRRGDQGQCHADRSFARSRGRAPAQPRRDPSVHAGGQRERTPVVGDLLLRSGGDLPWPRGHVADLQRPHGPVRRWRTDVSGQLPGHQGQERDRPHPRRSRHPRAVRHEPVGQAQARCLERRPEPNGNRGRFRAVQRGARRDAGRERPPDGNGRHGKWGCRDGEGHRHPGRGRHLLRTSRCWRPSATPIR